MEYADEHTIRATLTSANFSAFSTSAAMVLDIMSPLMGCITSSRMLL